ncbi:MAG: right-handed parallel beta-helix repeat-containing protein [Clostridia bacterium]|nr:right-handed parallel beta-helix repeat-containing protein [Clostridia bacterium]
MLKRIIALFLISIMLMLPLVGCNNTTPPTESNSPETDAPGADSTSVVIGEVNGKILSVYVSASGKEDANGTKANPYATIEAARDAVRNVSKAEYEGIDVVVMAGTYIIAEPIAFTSEDSGTAPCPVRYIGEEGAYIVGGVALTADDFTKATGDALQYMPADVQDKIVQIDMTKIGFTVDQIRALLDSRQYITDAPVLTVGGERQTIARYPNSDWLNIGAASTMIDKYGNPTMATDNEGGEFEAVSYHIEYGEEHMEHTLSWHSLQYVRAAGHYNVLWVQDLGDKISFSADDDIMTVPYYGGYAPKEGGLLYWYNIPEELDIPGEYYIDENAILYYYPGEGFDTADISLPLATGFVRLNDTDYITFENLAFESALEDGITGTSDYLTIKDCDISAVVGEKAIRITGYNVLIQGNHIHNLSQGGIALESGDLETLTQSNSRVYNNYIHDWGISKYPYADGIAVDGVGILVDHNVLTSSNAAGISGEGAYVIVEYNHIYDILRTSDDIGATGNSGLVGNITRYNYIHNIGSVGAAAEVDALNDYGSAGIYWDGGSSFAEAYGNVIQTIKGHGVIMNGGRGLKVHGNLIVDCTKWYIQCAAMFYARALESGFTEYKDVYPDYVTSAVWVEANPELSQIVEDLSTTTSDNPMAWCTTYGDEIYNNWCHYNKASATITNWGTRPYWIEDHVYTFSPDTIQVSKDGVDSARTSTYNSRRQKLNMEELLTKTAVGTIEITWEQFNEIGIVTSDWNFDIELPALLAE